MLYTWRGSSPECDRHDNVYGVQYFNASRYGEGKGQRLYKELGGSDRRLHIYAYGCELPDEYGIQQSNRYRDYP